MQLKSVLRISKIHNQSKKTQQQQNSMRIIIIKKADSSLWKKN